MTTATSRLSYFFRFNSNLTVIMNIAFSSSGTELPLVYESYGLLNIFPFLSILDTGYPILNLHLANVLFDVILPSVLGSSLWSFHNDHWGYLYCTELIFRLFRKKTRKLEMQCLPRRYSDLTAPASWRHYNLKGRGYNVSAEVPNFYAATSQIPTKFRLSEIWQTVLPHKKVKYKMRSSIFLT